MFSLFSLLDWKSCKLEVQLYYKYLEPNLSSIYICLGSLNPTLEN